MPLQILSVYLSARAVTRLQPAKLDAMEAHYRTKALFLLVIGDLRDLHKTVHSFPTRRSSDLLLHCRCPLSPQVRLRAPILKHCTALPTAGRSEEHTSELQSHGLISYAVFC